MVGLTGRRDVGPKVIVIMSAVNCLVFLGSSRNRVGRASADWFGEVEFPGDEVSL